MEDDVYKGMFIPKGSLVFGNIWCVRKRFCLPSPRLRYTVFGR